MHVYIFVEYLIHVLHAVSMNSTVTQSCHSFIVLLTFNFFSMSRANLVTNSIFTKATLYNLGQEGSPSFLDLHIHF